MRYDRRSPSEKSNSSGSFASPKLYSFLAPGPTYIAPTSGFFFAVGNHGTSLIDFLPSRLAADRLLQQYWLAVHPIARMVHRPSFERRYETFWNEVQMGIEPVGSLQAIVFAAMFSGVVSMPDEVILRDFGVAKKALEENFQQGTETALTRANLLRTTKVETLQAFVMYMVCMVSLKFHFYYHRATVYVSPYDHIKLAYTGPGIRRYCKLNLYRQTHVFSISRLQFCLFPPKGVFASDAFSF